MAGGGGREFVGVHGEGVGVDDGGVDAGGVQCVDGFEGGVDHVAGGRR